MMYYLDKELLKSLMQDDICMFVVCVNSMIINGGPAPIVEWSKSLSLTARCLSHMLDFKFGNCEKVTSDLGVDSDFSLVVRFPLP